MQKPKRIVTSSTISKRQGEGSWGESHDNLPFDGSPGDESFTAPVLAPAANPVQPVKAAGGASREVPAAHKMKIGDWIAQWDEEYQAWFFYNAITGRIPDARYDEVIGIGPRWQNYNFRNRSNILK